MTSGTRPPVPGAIPMSVRAAEILFGVKLRNAMDNLSSLKAGYMRAYKVPLIPPSVIWHQSLS
jgi:hypothetical protein